eukprot:763940-Hanusia_phi.AAC.4
METSENPQQVDIVWRPRLKMAISSTGSGYYIWDRALPKYRYSSDGIASYPSVSQAVQNEMTATQEDLQILQWDLEHEETDQNFMGDKIQDDLVWREMPSKHSTHLLDDAPPDSKPVNVSLSLSSSTEFLEAWKQDVKMIRRLKSEQSKSRKARSDI